MTIESINMLASQLSISPLLIAVIAIWTIIWKGMALWKAAGLRQKGWFIALLIINTLGILEIIYIYFISKKYKVEVVESTE